MGFSVLSWNVEHFKGGAQRLQKVTDHIAMLDPDVFGLLEIENLNVVSLIQNHFPDYHFNIADGPPYHVLVRGWSQLSGTTRTSYLQNISDHSALHADVICPQQRVARGVR